MRGARSIISGISPSAFRIAGVVALLLAFGTLSGQMSEVSWAKCQVDDYEAGILAIEEGDGFFFGRCLHVDFRVDDVEFREMYVEQLRQELSFSRERLADVQNRLAEDPIGQASASIAVPAMVVFALLFGAASIGSVLQTGTAAWSLSNGWGRRRWYDTFLITVVGTILAAYLILLVLYLVAFFVWTAILDVPVGLAMPGFRLLTPIPGVLFYGLVGFAGGLLTRRELGGILVGAVVGIADLILGNLMEQPVMPSRLQAAALGHLDGPPHHWVAAGILFAAATLIAVSLRWWFLHRMDVPDRPL